MPGIRRIRKISSYQRNRGALFSRTNTHKQLIRDNGTHIVKNKKINSFTELVLNAADKMSPIMNKHPKFNKAIMFISEKLINLSEKIRSLR